jgi:hypothetical protein
LGGENDDCSEVKVDSAAAGRLAIVVVVVVAPLLVVPTPTRTAVDDSAADINGTRPSPPPSF